MYAGSVRHQGLCGACYAFSTADTIAAVNAIPEPLSDAVVNQAPTVENAYNEIQKLVVMLKSDMASALSILITYTDADGD